MARRLRLLVGSVLILASVSVWAFGSTSETESAAKASSFGTISQGQALGSLLDPLGLAKVAKRAKTLEAPARLVFPGGPTIPVKPIKLDAGGSLNPPDDPRIAGWWTDSQRAGADLGSTVIVGHIDSRLFGIGAFSKLLVLRSGQQIRLQTAHQTYVYVVSSRHEFAKSTLPVEQIFRQDGPASLVLITCGGAFDHATHHYRDNIVITAVPA